MTDSFKNVALVWIDEGGPDDGASLRIANALGGSQLWMLGNTHAFSEGLSESALDEDEMHVSGYFALDVPFDDVGEVLKSAPDLPTMRSGCFMPPSASISADEASTVLVVWTKIGANAEQPTDDVLGIVKAFNEWAETLDERGQLLSTHRLDLFDNTLITHEGLEKSTYRSSLRNLRAIIPFRGSAAGLAPTVARLGRPELHVVIQPANLLCAPAIDPFMVVNAS